MKRILPAEKSVAITTWWHYRNYGTALQVSALRNTIKSLGFNADVVKYVPHEKQYPISSDADDAIAEQKSERFVDKKRDAKFDSYLSENLTFTVDCAGDDDFKKLNSKYAAFVAGSDQIWTPIAFDSRYFLDFVDDNRKKIAYAPSVGVASIENDYVKEQMKNLISQFAHLSVREEQGARLIQDLAQRQAETVLDPTLLLEYSDWRKIIPASKNAKQKEKYILCYFLGENRNAWKYVSNISAQTGLSVKVLPIFSEDAQYGEIQEGVGPKEFFNLIDDAEVVLTDSFHGTIFSVICSKPFYVFERFKNTDKRSQNSRIHNLLSLTELESRMIGYDAIIDEYSFDVSFCSAKRAISQKAKESKKFLEESLNIDSPLVSVIIPAYKVKKYIKQCIESVISQTYKNLEIIIIDDGSPDKSGEIADSFQKQDNRVNVVHKKNEGVSTARNVGLDIARGEFVVFVDSDDCIAPDYVEYLLGLAKNTQADVAASINPFNEYNLEQIESDYFQTYSQEQALEEMYLYRVGVAVWNKIYKRSFLNKNQVRFLPQLWFGEGMTFNIAAFQNANHVGIGLRRIYYQRYNTESAVRKFNIKNWECGFRALKYQKKHMTIQDKQVMLAYNFHYWWSVCSVCREIYKLDDPKIYSKQLKKYTRFIRRNILSALLAPFPKSQKKLYMQIFISPRKGLAIITEQEKKAVLERNAEDTKYMPWDNTTSTRKNSIVDKSFSRTTEIEDLKAENARLRVELDSHLSIKRSARLLAGNIKRRVRHGKNRGTK